jgi:voltage-gated potassium channel Kch
MITKLHQRIEHVIVNVYTFAGTNITVELNLDMTSTEMTVTEPDHGDLPTNIRICSIAQLGRLERLVAFEYYSASFSTATLNTDYSIRGGGLILIPPGLTRYTGCITIQIFGDDRPENNETLTIIFEPLSTIDRGPNVTINIIDTDRK